MKKRILVVLLLLSQCALSQNSSLRFTGSTQYINIPDNNAIDLSVNYTLETWIYPTGPGTQATQGGIIINKENSYEIARFTDGSIQYALSASGLGNDWAWINTGLVAPLNTWSHVAFVKSGTSLVVYLNSSSVFISNAAPATQTGNASDLRVASRSNGIHNFDGRFDEMRIWNVARTQAQIKSTMFNSHLSNSESGLVAYYRMNEGSGAVTVNSSSNTTGIDGTLVGTPAWIVSPVQFGGNALSFDGVDDIVTIPDDNTLDITNAITIEAWVYATNNVRAIQNVISKSSQSSNNGYIFPRTDNAWATVSAYLYVGGVFRSYATTFPSLNTWHHLAMTYDGSNVRLFVNGTQQAVFAQTGTINVNTNPLVFGNQSGYSEFFGGRMDDVRIWNVARTASEISSNMFSELNPVLQTGLVSYYTFNQGIQNGTNTGLTNMIDMKLNNNGVASGFAFSGTSSNMVSQPTALFILPVSWLSFFAQKQSGKILLNWSTAEEINANKYVVQVSSNGTIWIDIGTVSAALNSTSEQHYSFIHDNPVTGMNYYRIMQKDLDGKASYSKIISFLFQEKVKRLLLYPNPLTNGQLNIQLEIAGTVSIFNNAGNLVWNNYLPVGARKIDLSRLASGIYQLRAGAETVKLVVQ